MKSNDVNNKDIILDQKINQYAESFTIHGLPRILTGNKTEKIIWTIFVILAMSLGGFMTYRYVTKYLRYEVSHNFSRGKTDKAFYPSATICLPITKERMEWYYFFDCEIPKRFLWNASNGIFNIEVCNIGGINDCDNDSIIWRDDLKGVCFTLFPIKKYYQLTEKARLGFHVADDLLEIKQVSVTIHDQDIDPLFQTPQIQITPNKRYVVNLKKTMSKRLPHPFPSNCTNKTKEHNFPGNYNRRTCLFVNRYVNSYKKSSVMTSIGKLYVPEKTIKENNYMMKYPNEIKSNAKFYDMFTEVQWANPICPLSCYDVEYEITYSFQAIEQDQSNVILSGTIENKTDNLCFGFEKNFTKFEFFYIELSFQHPELFDLMEEKQAYTFENLCAELGGFLGLMIGISIISVVEIFAYFLMLLIKKITKK